MSSTTYQPRFRSAAVRVAASAISGVLLAACFPRFDLHFLVWVAVAPLLVAVLGENRLTRAYLYGALAGVVFLVLSLYWFVSVMVGYGNMTFGLAVVSMIAFLIVFSSFWGVFALVEAWVSRRSMGLALALAPFLWVSLELARTYYFIKGFPWNLLGYAVKPEGLRQIASVTAVYGLSFLAAATSALLVWFILGSRPPTRRYALAVWIVALFAANRLLAPPPMPRAREVAVLLQPDVPLGEAALASWAPWRDPTNLENLVQLSLAALPTLFPGQAGPPLIVWPENSAPFFYNRGPVFRAAIQGMAEQGHAVAIVGAVNFDGPGQSIPRESADVVDSTGHQIFRYDKIHLVPFGEYTPSWLKGVAGKITTQVGDFVPGRNYGFVRLGREEVGVFICYESIFPQLVRRLTPPGASVLVNISDDAWYGDSSARFQHLEMVEMRALENHRYILRDTNDGITVVIDPYGRITRRLAAHQRATLTARFSYVAGRTFYNAHGDVFAWACAVITGLMVALRITKMTA
ncbi:MAG: apolipoprotein N-acyltransferase [Terriglobia bacterium]